MILAKELFLKIEAIAERIEQSGRWRDQKKPGHHSIPIQIDEERRKRRGVAEGR